MVRCVTHSYYSPHLAVRLSDSLGVDDPITVQLRADWLVTLSTIRTLIGSLDRLAVYKDHIFPTLTRNLHKHKIAYARLSS